jgi:1-acyl-sn-glycerol-3-phosphate acyltransferase
MAQRIDYYWRLFGTGFSFALFGLGGLLLSLMLFPSIHLMAPSRDLANRRCQYVVHLSFRAFIWTMRSLGVLTYEVVGIEKLRREDVSLIVANHPSLIDIVFLVSLLPQALCVVKKAAWSNPFMAGVMWATGYIPNDDPVQFIDACVRSIEQGRWLVIFPEGTRSVPGQPMKLKRGAATIIAKSRQPFIPITITSDPTTLTKAEKWYDIPAKRVHFRIVVGNQLDPRPVMVEGEHLGRTNRRINRLLTEVLSVHA